jgi:hypothetical protein
VSSYKPEQLIESLLQYTDEPPSGDFTATVVRTIRREQRTRKAILLISGLIGILFGLAGVVALSDSISRFFTLSLSPTSSLPVSLAILSVLLFLGWLFNDELNLSP